MADPTSSESAGASPDGHDHSLTVEGARLLGAVQEWARATFPTPPGGRVGTDCEWCPVCQFVAVLRGERPELSDRMVEAGATLLAMGRAFVESALAAAAGDDLGNDADDVAVPEPAPRPRPRPRPEGS